MKEPAKEKDQKDPKDLQGDLDKLVTLGKKKGFLTYEDVNETLSDAIDSSEDIDQVFDVLDGQDIKVVDSGEETPVIAAEEAVAAKEAAADEEAATSERSCCC